MYPASDLRLEECGSTDEVLERIGNLVKPYSADITRIRLLCHKGDMSSILCMIDAAVNASAIAAAIGGIVFGFSLVCRTISPVRVAM